MRQLFKGKEVDIVISADGSSNNQHEAVTLTNEQNIFTNDISDCVSDE